jgi:hypothetical protein
MYVDIAIIAIVILVFAVITARIVTFGLRNRGVKLHEPPRDAADHLDRRTVGHFERHPRAVAL